MSNQHAIPYKTVLKNCGSTRKASQQTKQKLGCLLVQITWCSIKWSATKSNNSIWTRSDGAAPIAQTSTLKPNNSSNCWSKICRLCKKASCCSETSKAILTKKSVPCSTWPKPKWKYTFLERGSKSKNALTDNLYWLHETYIRKHRSMALWCPRRQLKPCSRASPRRLHRPAPGARARTRGLVQNQLRRFRNHLWTKSCALSQKAIWL